METACVSKPKDGKGSGVRNIMVIVNRHNISFLPVDRFFTTIDIIRR